MCFYCHDLMDLWKQMIMWMYMKFKSDEKSKLKGKAEDTKALLSSRKMTN